MSKYDRFAPVLHRVSIPLRQAYETSTLTDLLEENRKFVRSWQAIDRITKLILGLIPLMLLVPWPLALVIRRVGIVVGTPNEFIAAVIVTGLVCTCVLAYLQNISFKADNVRRASEAILNRFEESVRALEQMRYRMSEDRRPFNGMTVHENLVAMARDVLDAEGLRKYLSESGKLSLVSEIIGMADHINGMGQLLDNALSCQALFGLSFVRRDLFHEAGVGQK